MIKVEVENVKGALRLVFTSNDDDKDRYTMDIIGNAIMTKEPKRGGFLKSNIMVVDVRKEDGEE